MYIAADQGQTTPWTTFWCQQNPLVILVIATSFKNVSLKSDFIHFFPDFIHVYSPGTGLTTPWERNFDINRNILSLWSFVPSFKNLFEVWSYTIFFMILYMYIAPGEGQTAPRGQSFDVNRNVLSLNSFVASLKKMFLKSDFIQFFLRLIYVYRPRAGADSPQGTKYWCQQKGHITLPICCKFQRNLFEVWFYTIFFHDLIHVYSLRAAGIQSPGDKVLMSTETIVTSVICC